MDIFKLLGTGADTSAASGASGQNGLGGAPAGGASMMQRDGLDLSNLISSASVEGGMGGAMRPSGGDSQSFSNIPANASIGHQITPLRGRKTQDDFLGSLYS